jgi:DNA-binding transcriptional MerR regulator
MMKSPEILRAWTGNIDELAEKVSELLRVSGRPEVDPLTTRLVRDYIQRGLLGPVQRSGKELVFDYSHLLRFVSTRVLLADGWSLQKIAEHLDHCPPEELEAFLPQTENRAMATLKRIRQEGFAASEPSPTSTHFRRAAAMSPLQIEMRHALRRLGLPEDGPATEAVTLMAITPWFQALVTTGRISRITPEEAEEIGGAVTASLLKLARRKEFRK